jgi:hypothetical protein
MFYLPGDTCQKTSEKVSGICLLEMMALSELLFFME